MGNQHSEKQEDKHLSKKDTKEAAGKKESSFARFLAPTSPDDLNHGKSKSLTGATSQGLGPAKPDVPQNREQSVPTTGDISQDADLVKVNQLCMYLAGPEDLKSDTPKPRLQQATPERQEESRSFILSEQKPVAKETTEGSIQKTWTDGTRAIADSLEHHKDASLQVAFSEVVDKSPRQQVNCFSSYLSEESIDSTCHETDRVEPPDSTQTPNQPRAQVNDEENALQEADSNPSGVTVISLNYQYCFRANSEQSRASAAKLRLRQKLEKKLKSHPQDGSQSSQQTAEETDTEQESSQQQGQTAKPDQKLHQIPKHDQTDCDTSVNPAEPQVPEVEQTPAAASTTAAADANITLRLQCQHEVPVPQDTAVTPKKTCTFINQNQPEECAGSVAAEEKLNGNNEHAGKERPEPDLSPAPGPQHKAHNEGRWHPFTVNQSCPHKARCHHNQGKDLPPNVQKWFDECPNYLREPPRVTTAKLATCFALKETQEEAGDSHQ